MRTLPSPPVMLVTDRKQAQFPLDYIVEQACEAGCRWVSLREKDLAYDELHVLFNSLHRITEKHGALLSVHACAQVGLKLGANAVHLAAHEDMRTARSLLGEQCIIGQSCHTISECLALPHEDIDYGLLGPMFPTASKPNYNAAFNKDDVIPLTRELDLPLLGIGGVINKDHIQNIHALGMHGFAVMGGVMRAQIPRNQMYALIAAYHDTFE